MSLSSDCFLACTITAETYYRDALHKERPTVWVSSSCSDGSGEWQFDIEEYDFDGRPSTRLVVTP